MGWKKKLRTIEWYNKHLEELQNEIARQHIEEYFSKLEKKKETKDDNRA